MPDAYIIEVCGRTAGIVARDSQSHSFNFFSAARPFNIMEGQRFSDPLAAERVARMIAKHGSLPHRGLARHCPDTAPRRFG
jgi:hypothetical protein